MYRVSTFSVLNGLWFVLCLPYLLQIVRQNDNRTFGLWSCLWSRYITFFGKGQLGATHTHTHRFDNSTSLPHVCETARLQISENAISYCMCSKIDREKRFDSYRSNKNRIKNFSRLFFLPLPPFLPPQCIYLSNKRLCSYALLLLLKTFL